MCGQIGRIMRTDSSVVTGPKRLQDICRTLKYTQIYPFLFLLYLFIFILFFTLTNSFYNISSYIMGF